MLEGSLTVCQDCASEIAPGLLSCPVCKRLTHSQKLKELMVLADEAERSGRVSEALETIRDACTLLPPESAQYQTLRSRVDSISRQVDTGAVAIKKSAMSSTSLKQAGGVAGAIALLLWKFKFIAVALLSKIKLLGLGLTKMSTLFSMFASIGVYWAQFGWKFGVGLVLSIYVHEMGHVAALKRFGIKASAPMFIPGVGALVRLQQHVISPIEDARIGLAGPVWGTVGALAAFAVYFAGGGPSWGAIGHIAAWINLFNLMPVWQLDGARGFRSLTRTQRWIAVAALAGLWVLSNEGLLLLIIIFAVMKALNKEYAATPDNTSLLTYLLLICTLTFLAVPNHFIPVIAGLH